MKLNKFSFIIAILIFLLIPFFAFSQETTVGIPKLIVFYSPTCHKCVEIKNAIMPIIEKEFKGKIIVEYRDISDIENLQYLLNLKEKYKPNIEIKVPVFYFQGRFLGGDEVIERNLKSFIVSSLNSGYIEEELPRANLVEFFQRFNLLGITLAGLEDGINPCAFTVIVFFISYLAFQGYKKRELVIIGFTFIFTVFVAYLLIGLSIFNFMYALKGFRIVTKMINIVIGIFSIILGIFALYDFFKFKKTKDTEALVLQLPKVIKNQIHSVIGLHYRKFSDKVREVNIFKLILSAIITGVLVTLLEAVCTGQLYLPTITYIVKTSSLKVRLQGFGYLIFYNLLFITPLVIVFLLALFGVTSEQFSKFLKRHLGIIKIIMAILFFVLGIALIYFQIPPKISKAEDATEFSLSSEKTDKFQDVKNTDYFSWDFGQVKKGAILKHNFILNNESKNTLNIKEINTSCGCTVSQVNKKNLLPGESTLIEVQFNTQGYSGAVQQYIYVYTDNPENPILKFTIKAEVFTS